MIVGTSVKGRGEWHGAADTITLDEQTRHRRRMAMVSDNGIAFLLDLADSRFLKSGDAIELDDGRLIAVAAKPERLIEIRARDTDHLLVLAWQIGSRHLAAEIHDHRILIREDSAMAELLAGLGATLERVESGFDPQVGAARSALPPSPERAAGRDGADVILTGQEPAFEG
ncbi:urease accessory protein UreE [Fulvimarina sp. 2208YS6-2-32]|uniref:Urease accessory protein UreE n=1 Tax=Fulvimarina uroteuthidis TaxID=3098149 RepID=A0ABU5I2G9_9HYPH|nr:urease accessory protein UreE [Fulvimarina sp. 2208YS6-2-32]MDY8109014.1 urease accessory protein UreE [Fulvimarina sp. 2208YS6-2-32]